MVRSGHAAHGLLVSTVIAGGTACDNGSLLLRPDAALGPLEVKLDAEAKEPAHEGRGSEAAMAGEAPSADAEQATVSETAAVGRRLGRYRLTYYWATAEKPGTPDVRRLRDKRCKPIAKVSRRFAKRLRLEGTGVLEDGRVVNVAGNCKCGSVCYTVARKSWGIGARNRKLSPFRSIAVDRRHLSVGRWLYIEELDGLRMPGRAPWGGFVHDGCVVADDVGGGVRGRHLDFFAARRPYYEALHGKHKLSRVTAYDGRRRCAEHEESRRGKPPEGAVPLS